MLESLYIHNFKSVYKCKFEFGKLNCLIAPNNSGNSNLVDALPFLDNLIYFPKQAFLKISTHKINNFHYDEDEIKLNAKFKISNTLLVGNELINYDISLLFISSLNIKTKNPNIDIIISGKIKSIEIKQEDLKNGFGLRIISNFEKYIDNYASYDVLLSKKAFRGFEFMYNHTTLNYSISNIRYQSTKNIVNKLLNLQIAKQNEELQTSIDFTYIFNKTSLFDSYYFHPNEIRKSQQMGIECLWKDGVNLTEYLKNLDEDTLENISTSLIGEVSLINAIELKDSFTTELFFKEELNNKTYDVGIKDVSDGTLHFLAILTALLGNTNSFSIMIEEPERHIHMKVLLTILNMMRENDKQIFFTTHSTEILQQLKLDEILFMFRDYDGNTKGQRAKDIPNIEKIMKIYKNDLVEMIQIGVLDDLGDEL
jgi:predicted ATPase